MTIYLVTMVWAADAGGNARICRPHPTPKIIICHVERSETSLIKKYLRVETLI
jgi:hypothetical protein